MRLRLRAIECSSEAWQVPLPIGLLLHERSRPGGKSVRFAEGLNERLLEFPS